LVESGAADLVGLARALVADPRFAEKAIRDEDDRIEPCIGCNECTLVPFSCPVNPRAGREAELTVRQAQSRRRVVVVGAGPAGVGAATVAASRGHEVLLFDGAPEAGGVAALLGRANVVAAWHPFGALLQRQVRDSGVDFRPGTYVDAAGVAALQPDAVVIATGAQQGAVDFETDTEPRTGLQVLAEGFTAADGPVVVVGGAEPHLEPFLVAEAMLAAGRPVTLLSELVTAGQSVEPRTLNFYLGRLLHNGVTVVPMSRAVRWHDGVLHVTNLYGGGESTLEAAVVVAVRRRLAADQLARELEQSLPAATPVHVIGDALAPRRMTHAALEGARIGLVV
jgi:2,4-dienoyl-CoA reductase (NADPH2)